MAMNGLPSAASPTCQIGHDVVVFDRRRRPGLAEEPRRGSPACAASSGFMVLMAALRPRRASSAR